MATDGEYIYYTDLVELWCHDINTASFQWKAESPFEDGNFSGALWVDPESRNIFISDKKRIMCLKVNK